MVKVISTPGPKAIYIEKLKLAVLYKLDNHEIFPRLRGLFSSINKKKSSENDQSTISQLVMLRVFLMTIQFVIFSVIFSTGHFQSFFFNWSFSEFFFSTGQNFLSPPPPQ